MSSATSTKGVRPGKSADTRRKADAQVGRGADTPVGPYPSGLAANGAAVHGALTSWQFFLLAALGCATAVNVMVRGQGVTTIILLTTLIGSTALVGIAALRTLNPLVTDEDDRTVIIGGRTRAALEREKMLVLRAIKELEFDKAMGKVSDADFDEMGGRLRARAARLIRQLDAGAGYRGQIEQDLERRLGAAVGSAKASPSASSAKASAERDEGRSAKASAERDEGRSAKASAERDEGRSAKALAERDEGRSAKASAERICACGTANDHDAKFCKSCGRQL